MLIAKRWVAYHRGDSLFVKTIEFRDGATYPDGGCNFETFTNKEMLEVEALGPLVELAPGEATEHTEHWQLVRSESRGDAAIDLDSDAIADWMAPVDCSALDPCVS